MMQFAIKPMLKKSVFIMTLLCGTSTLVAVTAASQGKSKAKYAILDMQAVILTVEEGRQARKELEKEFEAKKKDHQKNLDELQKMRKDWEAKQALLSDQAKMKMQNEFQQKFVALRTKEMKFEQEMKKREQETVQKIAIKVTKLVQSYAKERGFEAVFESNTAGMLYVKDPVNITSVVIDMYGKQNGAPTTAKKTEKKK